MPLREVSRPFAGKEGRTGYQPTLECCSSSWSHKGAGCPSRLNSFDSSKLWVRKKSVRKRRDSMSMSGYLRPLLLPRQRVFPPSRPWHQNPLSSSNLLKGTGRALGVREKGNSSPTNAPYPPGPQGETSLPNRTSFPFPVKPSFSWLMLSHLRVLV